MADGVVGGLGREGTVTVCMDGPSHEDAELPWSHCDEHRRANLCVALLHYFHSVRSL